MDDTAFLGLAMSQWLIACCIVMAAAIVQYRAGVGFGLTAAPLLALTAPLLVPGPIIILTLLTAGWAMARTWNGIVWREITWSVSGRFAGSLLGLVVYAFIDSQEEFQLVFGIFVALAVLMSMAGVRLRFTMPMLFTMGTISGLSASVTSVGGPPMALAYQDQPPAHARPNMSAYFALGCVVLIVVLGASGHMGWDDAVRSAILVPALLAGIAISPLFAGLIDRNFRHALLAICSLAALLLIAKGLGWG